MSMQEFVVRRGLIAMLLSPLAAWGAATVSCDEGCRPVTACSGNVSPYLLCLVDRDSDVKLSWRIDSKIGKGESLHVYAGNPARAAGIPERHVEFAGDGDSQTGSFTFRGEELGTGPLLVVTTLKNRREETILSWIPFRTSTEAETRESIQGADAAGNWSVDVVPAFVQVSTGWRELPRTRDTRSRSWLSLAADPTLADDADLDGSVAGVPGLVVQVSAPWAARDDWKTRLQEMIGVPPNHAVKFESLHWEEKPDRVVEGIPGVGPISLRNYYTIVTMFTNASTATYAASDIGLSGNARYFAHETSASLKQVDHPMLWSSYSLNDYSSDSHLLGLLFDHVEQNRPSLEFGQVQRVNGDGGPAVFRAAFTMRVKPWADESTSKMQQPQAGIVGIDVLAVRTGMGGIKVPAANATGVQAESFCLAWACGSDDGLASIDFNKPPRGYEVSSPQASTLTISGQIPLIDGIKSIAERSPGAAVATLPEFPASAQFALAASLRAGAMVRRGGLFGHRVDGIVPINSYAQYVVRFTVATFPGQQLIATDTAVTPSAASIDVVAIQTEIKSFGQRIQQWLRDNFALSGILLLAVFIALLLLIPGFRALVSAFFGLLAAIVRKITPSTGSGGGGAS